MAKMKKEVLLAISIGFIIGLVLTYFTYKSQLIPKTNQEIVSPLPASVNTEENQNQVSEQILEIISPLDQSIITETSVKIRGATSPFSHVVFMGEKGEKVLQADESGNFEDSLLLVSGENEITITSYNTNGSQKSKTITVVYSTVEI